MHSSSEYKLTSHEYGIVTKGHIVMHTNVLGFISALVTKPFNSSIELGILTVKPEPKPSLCVCPPHL